MKSEDNHFTVKLQANPSVIITSGGHDEAFLTLLKRRYGRMQAAVVTIGSTTVSVLTASA